MQASEQLYFRNTLALIKEENEIAKQDVERLEPVVADLFKQINRADDWNLLIMHETQDLMLSRARTIMRNLGLARKTPYFTRVDFIPNGQKDADTYYIGKYGVMDSKTMEPMVVDWRAPISNLYYSGQLGPTHYIAPDGQVHGNLVLKRQFNVSDGKLVSYYDADVLTRDKLLDEVLGSVSQGKLKEVVTTIQAEQNAVIRHPLERSLIVQGVAGSGKTTIALHRIAYLLYTHQKTLHPRTLMILAPNPLFLDYISSVLPDLGVSEVNQLTFPGLCEKLLEGQMPKLVPDDRLSRALSGPDEAMRLRLTSARKGAARVLDEVDAFLDGIEEQLIPKEDLYYGPVLLYSVDELRRMLLTDLRAQPFNQRTKSLCANAKLRVASAAVRIKELIQEDCVRRADLIRSRMPDGPERREKLKTLYQSRDLRLVEADDNKKPFLKDLPKRWPALKTLDLYAQFLGGEKLRAVGEDDLPAFVWMARRVTGLSGRMALMHMVVDEAQDYTAAQLRLLRELYPRATYTLVGDMGQSIHFYKPIPGWQVAESAIGGADRHGLVTSYRSTIEIMQRANRVAARHPYEGQTAAVPVLRHGDEPQVQVFDSRKAHAEALAQVVSYLKEEKGYNSICVIHRSAKEAQGSLKRLEGAMLLDTEKADYQSGVSCATIDQVKGLEFDAVVLADADEGSYPDRPEYAKLLYVAMTRALHSLTILSLGALSPLLAE